jgi:histone arginine demethylase JMJD6
MGDDAAAQAVRYIASKDFDAWLRQPKQAMHPVIVPDLCKHWQAMTWTIDALRDSYGSRLVPYEDRQVPLEQALDRIQRSTEEAPAPYLYRCHLLTYLPELVNDILPLPGSHLNRLNRKLVRHPAYRMGLPELLVAGPGTRFPRLHCDIFNLHTVITQIRGDKEFVFHTPDQSPYLYPIAHDRNFSAIDKFDPVNLDQWPLYAQAAEPIRITVREGESIFVPSLWWHRTRILDKVSLAVTWDFLTHSNWDDYVEFRFLRDGKKGLFKSLKVFAYQNLIGGAMRAGDRFASSAVSP